MLPTSVAEAAPLAHVVVVANDGAVEPAGGIYEVGTRLTFRANPGTGFVFDEWTTAAGALVSTNANGPELEYLVAGDAEITARFVPARRIAVSTDWVEWVRTYDFDATGQPRATARGCVKITLGRTGAFTGKLNFDGETHLLAGTVDAAGRAALSLPRTGRLPLRVVLRAGIDLPQERLSVVVYDGEVCAMSSVSARGAPGLASSYTISLGLAGAEERRGYAILKRTLAGAFRVVGSLDNGMPFSFDTRPGIDHGVGGLVLPVDASLGAAGVLSGLIILPDPVLPVANFSARLQWITPPPLPPALPAAPPVSSVFVGPLGDDANPGTVESPLATLDAALAHLVGEGEIVMLPGDYEHASLDLAAARKVTLQAAPGHTASVFFGEKITGGSFTHHGGNVWKVAVQSTVPVQGSENRFWIFELGTPEHPIPAGTGLPQQRLRTTRLDHFRLVQAASVADVDSGNGRYFIAGGMLYLRTSDGLPPRPGQEFRIPSQAAADSIVHGAGSQCEITLRGLDVYFACNGADVSGAARYEMNGCKFFGSGNSGILTGANPVGIEDRCEYAANANDGSSPVNYGVEPSAITVIDPWAHDNGDEGHSLHGNCRGFYFDGIFEANAQGGITPAIGSNAVIQGVLTRGNVSGICPTVSPAVNLLVSGWTSIGDYDGLENWTTGLATVVDSRVSNPLNYCFSAIAGGARIAVFDTVTEGGAGTAGNGAANIVFSSIPFEAQRRETPQAASVNAFGARFVVPGPGQRIAPFSNRSPNGHFVARTNDGLGVSAIELAESFTIGTDGHVTIDGPNARQLTIDIDGQSGWFSGAFSDPARPGGVRSFVGAIFQSQHYGSGSCEGPGVSTDVTISIPYDVIGGVPPSPAFALSKPVAAGSARFGEAVAMSGTRVAVGARPGGANSTETGLAYLYDLKRANPTVPAAMFTDPNPVSGGKFGTAVAISGSRMIVGSPVDAPAPPGAARAYVYNVSSPNPSLLYTLANPNPASNGSFGSTVATSGIWMVVGAPADDSGTTSGGRVYVYAVLGATPTLMATISNPSPARNDRFGSAIAMSGTRVVVGAFQDDATGTASGRVYVYNVISSTPTVPFVTLDNPGPAEFDRFGFSVAIFGTRVAVGAIGDDTGATDAGSAYVFDLSGATPTLPVFTLTKPNPAAGDHFGHSVGIAGLRIVVGASGHDAAVPDAGSACVYELNSTTPTVTLSSPVPVPFDQFGRAVAADGPNILVGLPVDEAVAPSRGAVQIYTIGKTLLVPAGTSAVTEGGTFDSITIESGGSLTLQAPPAVPIAPGVPSARLTGIGSARHLAMEFVRSKSSNKTYVVEFGDLPDGASFQPALNAPIITPIDADLEHVIVEDIVAIADQPFRFVRLRVTSP